MNSTAIRVVILLIAMLIGGWLTYVEYPFPYQIDWTSLATRYQGSVINHDPAEHKLIVQMHDFFPTTLHVGVPDIAEFSYDDKTEWASIEYAFKDDIVEQKKIVRGGSLASQLPQGALVLILRDMDAPRFRAALIAVLKKSSL